LLPTRFAQAAGPEATAVTPSASRPTRSIEEAITLEGSSACLERSSLAAAVVRWLRVNAIDARVSIAVTANESPTPSLSFVVQREGETVAVRQFASPPTACQDVRASLSIAIAMAIEATILAPPTATPPASPSRSQPSESSTAPESLRVVSASPRVALHLDTVILVAVLPKLTMGGRIGVELELASSFSLDLSGIATLNSRASVGPGEADTRLVAGELDACWLTPRRLVRFRACGGAAGGSVFARGAGYAPSLSAHFPWAAFVARAGLRARLWQPLDLELGLSGFLPWIRPELQVSTSEGGAPLASRSLPSIGGGGDIGLVVTF
jgi:hypothetical protein